MQIKTFSPTNHRIKAVVYGASGSGKTYFAATAPKAIFASAEGGLLSTYGHKYDVGDVKYVDIRTVKDLNDLLFFLKKGGHGYESVVIDSITEINEIIKEEIEKKKGQALKINDWGDVARTIKRILRGFRDLDMHVIFTALEKAEKDDQAIKKIVPSLNGAAATDIAAFMDFVAYAYVTPTGEHKITLQPSEKLTTKSRGVAFEGDAPDNFSKWIELVAAIPLKEQAIEIVDFSPRKMTKETREAISIEYDDYLAQYPEYSDHNERIREAMKRITGFAAKLDDMNEDQAQILLLGMRKKNEERKNEKKLKEEKQKESVVVSDLAAVKAVFPDAKIETDIEQP